MSTPPKPPTLPTLPLVIVVWDDAWTDEQSVTIEDVRASHKPVVVTTIGWLLLDDEVGVSIANEFYGGTYRGRTFILRSMVKSVTPFKLARARAERSRHEKVDIGGGGGTVGGRVRGEGEGRLSPEV